MKALIRKQGLNGYEWEQDTVMLYPWPNGDDQGRPYTLEGYRYALCIDVPDEPVMVEDDDLRLNANYYKITSVQVEDEEGIEHTLWIATWDLRPYDP